MFTNKNLLIKISSVILFIIVISGGAYLLYGFQSESVDLKLVGDGCLKFDKSQENSDPKCILQRGDKSSELRDCTDDPEGICENSEYVLGKREGESQYLLFKAKSIADIMTVYRVNLEDLSKQEMVETLYYTEVKEECQNSKETYEENCFEYPITEEQRKDIWNNNKKYNDKLKSYK